MASFETHFGVGVAVVGAFALAAHAEGLSTLGETQWLFAVGVAASLFPDIDADDSRPVRAFFGLFGLIAGFVIATLLWSRFKLLDLGFIWMGIWLLIYFPIRFSFARLTVHRGLFHSLLMGAMLALGLTVVGYRLLDWSGSVSWLAGSFVLIGYLTHLVLDEIASVDLLGNRVKRSFGTALKPFSLHHWAGSLILFFMIAVMLVVAPDPSPILNWFAEAGFAIEIPPRLQSWRDRLSIW